MDPITFTVIGTPKPQPRPRAFARKFANGVVSARVYDAGTAEAWKGDVVLAARPYLPATPIDGPVQMMIEFRFVRPKGHFGSGRNAAQLKGSAPSLHTSKPDLDNLAKAVIDCLMQVGMFRDDGQVVKLILSKRYVDFGQGGACVRVEAIDPAAVPRDEDAAELFAGAGVPV